MAPSLETLISKIHIIHMVNNKLSTEVNNISSLLRGALWMTIIIGNIHVTCNKYCCPGVLEF